MERFTPLLREMIGSGLGACELLGTIRRDNPRTSVFVTAKRIQEVSETRGDSSGEILRSNARVIVGGVTHIEINLRIQHVGRPYGKKGTQKRFHDTVGRVQLIAHFASNRESCTYHAPSPPVPLSPRSLSTPRARSTFLIQQILSTLPESRDLANSMRLLASVCRVGRSLLPAIQRLVALTLLGKDTTGTFVNASGSVSNRGDSFDNLDGSASRSVGSGASGSFSHIGDSFGNLGGSTSRSLGSGGGSSIASAAGESCRGKRGRGGRGVV